MNKEILDLSIKLHISYAKALEKIGEILSSGAADTLDEAFLILQNIREENNESESFKESNTISTII